MFGILEFGKFLIGFNGLMLIVSCMMIDRLTWDCRWWGEQHHPDGAACKGGYAKFGVGTTFIFTTEFLLMAGSIVYTELERKRVDESKNFFSPDGTRTGNHANVDALFALLDTQLRADGEIVHDDCVIV